jgi:RNA-directed DNA polymerase
MPHGRIGHLVNQRVLNHPVIMVVDNDAGSTKVFQHLSNLLGVVVDGTAPFYYAYANLYVVPVPKSAVKTTTIEDLFDPSLLDRKIVGREFDRTGKAKDGTKWYGKFEFATKIIRPERSKIDFVRFEPLLDAFVKVIDDYSLRRVTLAAAAKAAAA